MVMACLETNPKGIPKSFQVFFFLSDGKVVEINMI